MGDSDAGRAVVVLGGDGAVRGVERPLRTRHDGWTRERQDAFCAAIARSGSVTLACRAVGLSTTSAYRVRGRLRGFAERWDDAIAAVRPTLEEAAFRRAVEGWDEPVFQGGRQVGVKRRYSDNLLRMLILRGTGVSPQDARPETATIEDATAALKTRLDMLARRLRTEG